MPDKLADLTQPTKEKNMILIRTPILRTILSSQSKTTSASFAFGSLFSYTPAARLSSSSSITTTTATTTITSSFSTSTNSEQDLVTNCLANYSIEVTPGAAKKVKAFDNVDGLALGTHVNVTYLVGADINESLDICDRLVQGGMKPVAHVPARAFPTLSDVEDYLSKLHVLGCDEVLVLGGGAAEPAGDLHESMQILESGLLQKYQFKKIGVAAHPEGHPDIEKDELSSAILRKELWAKDAQVELYYETQFCFESAPIVAWEKETRKMLKEHIDINDMPTVRLGIAGPAKISNLIKFGLMSGVGNSLSFLQKTSISFMAV